MRVIERGEQPPIGLEPMTCGLQNRTEEIVTGCQDNELRIDESASAEHALKADSNPLEIAADPIDPDLARLAALWKSIPDNVRQRIIGMAEAFAPTADDGKR